MTDLRALSLGDFAPAVGEPFAIARTDAPPIELVLHSATPLDLPGEAPPADPSALRRPFSLTFAGPPEPRLAQQIVPLTHARLGRLDLFLVPIAREADGMRYEAVFA